MAGTFYHYYDYLFWGFIGSEECSSSEQNEEIVRNSGFDASVWQVKNYLKKEYLLDPRSYEGIEWGAVNKRITADIGFGISTVRKIGLADM